MKRTTQHVATLIGSSERQTLTQLLWLSTWQVIVIELMM